ncbi:hypothetical protein HY380_02030 [Candidatus Saccharibacteria bacterium]|nr:hypothetical protein [Candidatus Saccharibacteria bacterium]
MHDLGRLSGKLAELLTGSDANEPVNPALLESDNTRAHHEKTASQLQASAPRSLQKPQDETVADFPNISQSQAPKKDEKVTPKNEARDPIRQGSRRLPGNIWERQRAEREAKEAAAELTDRDDLKVLVTYLRDGGEAPIGSYSVKQMQEAWRILNDLKDGTRSWQERFRTIQPLIAAGPPHPKT